MSLHLTVLSDGVFIDLHRFAEKTSHSGDRQLEPIFKALSTLAAEAHSRPTPCRIGFVASVLPPR